MYLGLEDEGTGPVQVCMLVVDYFIQLLVDFRELNRSELFPDALPFPKFPNFKEDNKSK